MSNNFRIDGHQLFLLLLFLLIFLSHPASILPLSYSLNTTALDGLWHRAAVMALLRLQAKSLITELNLSMTERIVFFECESEAQKVVQMAKCVAKLLRKRERIRAEANEEEERRKMANWEGRETQQWGEGKMETEQRKAETERNEKRKAETERIEMRKAEMKRAEKRKKPDFVSRKMLNILKGPFGETDYKRKSKIRFTDKDEAVNSFYTAQKHLYIRRKRRETIGGRFVHVDNLNELQRFWEMRQFCENYLSEMAERNAEFLRSQLPLRVNLRVNNLLDDKTSKANVQLMDHISNQLITFVRKVANRKRGPLWRRLSIVSPRLFSLASSSPRGAAQSKSDQLIDSLLLSPRLFSLSPNDGLFALPDLFNNPQMKSGKKRWTNAILELSGAGKAIRKALDRLEEERKRLEERVFPTVLELERRDTRWRDLLDDEQKRGMAQRGFAFLTKQQAELVYGNSQHRIEKAILALANLDDQNSNGQRKLKRKRRQFEVTNQTEQMIEKWENGSGQMEWPKEEAAEHFKVLAPYAFANSVADGVALEATVLSPSAFVSELISPVALSAQVLSPRAFLSAILSPEALFARVLSPSAFFSDILSPRALTPFILSPEAMFTEILTPRALEPRILSPEIGMIKVLSPEFLSPRIISPEQFAILVLSPAILSPEILSRQKMVVEIISPHILSGGSGEIDEKENERHQHKQGHEEGHHQQNGDGQGQQNGDGHGQHQRNGDGQGQQNGNGQGNHQKIGIVERNQQHGTVDNIL
ncbi:hypothetical protein niasHT_015927 [Heterodera trifolii]|uniref:Uncharacterized protein n=1 Tax=Heterodera trifolii TaxID=157864 RepID=A0ABD2KYQ9_9BILA